MSSDTNYDRRHFLGAAAMTIAAAEIGMIGTAGAQISKMTAAGATPMNTRTPNPAVHTSLGPITQIDAGLLNALPETAGLSARNLEYMRAVAEAWPEPTFVQQVVALLP